MLQKSTQTRRVPSPTRSFTLWWGLLGLACLIVIWQLLSIILGVSQAGVKRVPGLQDIIGAMIQFSGYWPGGLGAGDVTRGAERTIWGAVLGAAYNSWFTLVRVLVGFAFGVIAVLA